jgi:putative phage-type endonuclease
MGIKKIAFNSREEWLELRKQGIGGSDAAAVVGLSKWSSPLAVYADKLGIIPEREDNEAMRQGRDLEAYVAERFMEQTGLKVRRENHILINEERPFMFANIDRRIVGEDEGLECKTTSVYNRTDFEGGDVPPEYYAQCQHYMAVTGWRVWHLAILVLNKGFYVFRVERNEEDIQALIKAEQEFWENNVLAGIPPEPLEHDSETLIKLYPNSHDTYIPLYGVSKELLELNEKKKAAKDLEEEIKNLENRVKATLGDAGEGSDDNFIVTWKSQSRTSLDGTRLKKELPDVYETYSKESSFRVLRIKESKQNAMPKEEQVS